MERTGTEVGLGHSGGQDHSGGQGPAGGQGPSGGQGQSDGRGQSGGQDHSGGQGPSGGQDKSGGQGPSGGQGLSGGQGPSGGLGRPTAVTSPAFIPISEVGQLAVPVVRPGCQAAGQPAMMAEFATLVDEVVEVTGSPLQPPEIIRTRKFIFPAGQPANKIRGKDVRIPLQMLL